MEFENRPWGSYRVLLDDGNCKVKKITVKPKQSLSYQLHHRRSEDWFFISGIAVVTIDGKERSYSHGEKVHIPVFTKHCVRNDTEEDVVFIEIQTGEYFGEDDIIRISDMYGRC